MAVILKYPLEIAVQQIVHLPVEAQALSIEVQHNKLCMWALCEDAAFRQTKAIEVAIIMTGMPGVPEDILITHHFMGTKMLSNGGFVAHVFVAKVAVAPD